MAPRELMRGMVLAGVLLAMASQGAAQDKPGAKPPAPPAAAPAKPGGKSEPLQPAQPAGKPGPAPAAGQSPDRAEMQRLSAAMRAARDADRWPEAANLARQVLAMGERLLGPDHPDLADSLQVIATAAVVADRYGEAVAPLRRILQIELVRSGDQSEAVAWTRFNIGIALNGSNQLAEAEPLLRRALADFRRLSGETHENTGSAAHFLAENLEAQARFAEAEPYYRTALEITRTTNPRPSGDLERAYTNLAVNLFHQGREADAEPIQRQVIASLEARGQSQAQDMGISLSSLGSYILNQGRADEAAPLLRRGMEILERTSAPDAVALATGYNNLAFAQEKLLQYDAAETNYRRAVDIWRRALGENHDNVATGLNNLAHMQALLGHDADAEANYRRALAIWERILPADHPNMVRGRGNLGILLSLQPGRTEEALRLTGDSMEMARRRRYRALNVVPSAGDAGQAALSRARTEGGRDREDYLTTAYLAFVLAAYRHAQVTPAQAGQLRARAFEATQEQLDSAAGRAMAQTAARAAAGSGPLAETLRRQQDLAARALGLDRQLTAAAGGEASEATRLRRELDTTTNELASLDAEIHRQFPAYAEMVSPRSASLADTQARLQPGEGLLMIASNGRDIVVYAVSKTRVDWRLVVDATATTAERVRTLRCQLDPLGCLREMIASGAEDAPPPGPFDLTAAHQIYRDLVAPVEAALAGVDRLYVTTDGDISGLPLGLLVVEDPAGKTPATAAWLSDRYAMTVLPSVSSLRSAGVLAASARGETPFVGYGDPVLGGDPARSRGASNLVVFRSADANGFGLADTALLRSNLAPLPGTRVELNAMARTLGVNADTLRLGAAATERALRADTALSRARIIALATHGLLPGEVRGLQEPGLVLTPPGAPDRQDDGVLTASEVSLLSLTADWVILSACNTATSDGGSGADSLSSLARAFIYAGAKSLLASHWRVSDEVTAALTVETLAVQRANPRLTRAQALQAAMKAVRTGRRADGSAVAGWRENWAQPSAWAPFTLIANEDRAG